MKYFSCILISILLLAAGCDNNNNLYNDNMEDKNSPDSKAEILNYEMNVDGFICKGKVTNNEVIVSVPYGTVVGTYYPVIEISPGASITPASGTAVDFTAPVIFTVTSKDGTVTNQYNVYISETPNDEAKITELTVSIDDIDYEGIITGTEITVTAPHGTVIGSYSPVIYISPGATIDPLSGSLQDFSAGPVTYTVTAHDGITTSEYHVSIIENLYKDAFITELTMDIGGTLYTGNILGFDITINVPYGTAIGTHTPSISISTGASINPLSGSLQDFSAGPVAYTVTSEDEKTTNEYNVSVIENPNTEALITDLTMEINGTLYTGDINGLNITIDVPYGTAIGSHIPSITISPEAAISPLGGLEHDFSSGPVTYTVTAQDGTTTNEYTVSVNELPFDTVWHGDYTISSRSDITALANKETIDGTLTINIFSFTETNMTGLESLTRINGSLIIKNTYNLHDLDGLYYLEYIGGKLHIENNPDLYLINALEQVTYIGTDIVIYENPNLQTLSDLNGVTSISGSVSVTYNQKIGNITFLTNLTSCSNFYVAHNESLGRIGIGFLTTVNGNFDIIDNDNMNRIDIYNLDSVSGNFSITDNASLRHVYAQELLDDLSYLGGDSFIFYNYDD